MKTIRRILHPTDFSNEVEAATKLAFEMTKEFGAQLVLLNVYLPPMYIGAFGDAYGLPIELLQRLQQDTVRALDRVQKRAAEVGISAETIALEGVAKDVIVATAQNQNIDLIVMGTHGRTGFKHFLLGSVAEYVVRTAQCPVLTVRAPQLPSSDSSTAQNPSKS